MYKGINQYRQIDTETAVHNASPHRLIQMLFEGALKSVTAAKGAMDNGSPAQLGEHIKKAATIIAGLEEGLDKENGGELAENLERLYQHAQDTLVLAQSEKSVAKLDQVTAILLELKSGWDQVAPSAD
ncbi:B-type flagellar protein FliS [Marinobacterium nitratireducens]|uniref:Flagellar secretion chaperone FliS n=1 Tax=Marinobacterium nitratireducens TaxID=518897 RepID=A0A918DUR8_9GAMM|nr:flagellar export chaperone FliS [Marinobacterium nitratireducens]GGO84935.1 B-type flagellar protein FliS [Marinobacterium nitratireducens]